MKGQLVKICFLCLVLLLACSALPCAEDVSVKTGHPSQTADKSGTEAISEMRDIYDIKPPTLFGVNPAWLKYSLMVLCLILLLVLLFLAYRYWKKRQAQPESTAPAVSAEDKANALLREIKGLNSSQGKAYYFRLSAVFRGYIQDRYGVDALEMTTEELLPHIKRLKIDESMKQDSRSFIEYSDPVKFADMMADTEQMEAHYQFVRNFIEKTTPMPTVMAQSNMDQSLG